MNVLVYAFNTAAQDHERYRAWVKELIAASEPYGVSELVLSGFVRVVTHHRILARPASIEVALAFADALRQQPHAVPIVPGPRHWGIFAGLCRGAGAKGPLVADAYLAALAIESGSEWVTTDRDFARFPGLRWRHPLG